MTPGKLVKCIKPFVHTKYGEVCPKLNGIYTVREKDDHFGKSIIRLEEIINDPNFYNGKFCEVGFMTSYFVELGDVPDDLLEELFNEETAKL